MTNVQISEGTKAIYCHTCKRGFHPLGIMRHRAMHRDNFQDCKITYQKETITHRYAVDRL